MSQNLLKKIFYYLFIGVSSLLLFIAANKNAETYMLPGFALLIILFFPTFFASRKKSSISHFVIRLFLYFIFIGIPISTLFFCSGWNEGSAGDYSKCSFDVFGIFTDIFNAVCGTLFISAFSFGIPIIVYTAFVVAIVESCLVAIGTFFKTAGKKLPIEDINGSDGKFLICARASNKIITATIILLLLEGVLFIINPEFALAALKPIFPKEEVSATPQQQMEVPIAPHQQITVPTTPQQQIEVPAASNQQIEAPVESNQALPANPPVNYINKKFHCYRLFDGSRWVLKEDRSKISCFRLDSCNGGLGESNGGCYKWSLGPDGEHESWNYKMLDDGKIIETSN
ncbi:MAG: hypothetical protein K0R25_1235 [Rickettsiaceae bacterium]|jgi:hypothetical protein|nr:hypothetical protein [Rickettsiaceae bacterium]